MKEEITTSQNRLCQHQNARLQGSGHGSSFLPSPSQACFRAAASLYPLQGIQYFIEHKLLTPDIQDIARFLYKGEGLNKTAIGTYLGER